MSETRRIARVSPSTLYREVQGEAVLLQLDSGEYFGLDAIATRMWQLIVEKGELNGVAEVMSEEFDVDPSVLSRDINDVVEELVAKRLLELVPAEES